MHCEMPNGAPRSPTSRSPAWLCGIRGCVRYLTWSDVSSSQSGKQDREAFSTRQAASKVLLLRLHMPQAEKSSDADTLRQAWRCGTSRSSEDSELGHVALLLQYAKRSADDAEHGAVRSCAGCFRQDQVVAACKYCYLHLPRPIQGPHCHRMLDQTSSWKPVHAAPVQRTHWPRCSGQGRKAGASLMGMMRQPSAHAWAHG